MSLSQARPFVGRRFLTDTNKQHCLLCGQPLKIGHPVYIIAGLPPSLFCSELCADTVANDLEQVYVRTGKVVQQ